MKRSIILSAIIGMTCAAVAQMSTSKLVEITDLSGSRGYEIMDATAFADLQKQIREEGAAFNAALVEAKKQWAEDKENKANFQGTAVKPRKFKIVAQGNEELLNKRKEKLEERLASTQAKEVEKIERKYKAIRNPDALEKAQEKDSARAQAIAQSVSMVSKIMAEKLGRAIPSYSAGLMDAVTALGAVKKDEKKADKKDDKKADKKDEKADKKEKAAK